jgi:hypothetical protein
MIYEKQRIKHHSAIQRELRKLKSDFLGVLLGAGEVAFFGLADTISIFFGGC